jgi:heme O synthase-like polyprenyltransferase
VLASLRNVAQLWLAGKLIKERTRAAAQTLFSASIIHLPVLLLAMVAEGLARVVF